MLIPRYWARVDGQAGGPSDSDYRLRAWAPSAHSQADAELQAQDRLARLIARVHSDQFSPGYGEYAYARSAPREELLHEIRAGGTEPVAIVTRNRYGSLILNAARTLFLDVDLPPDGPLRSLWARLWGKPASAAERTLSRLYCALESVGDAAFRIYRTAAGFRVLGVDREYEPGSSDVHAFMRSAGSDPAFVTLCRVQQSFRARLTPKPWRIGMERPRGCFPFETPEAQTAFNHWLPQYEQASSGWATCRLIAEVGQPGVHPVVAPVLAYHDMATRINEFLPLA